MPSKRQKGAAWERECCRRLSLWATNGDRDDLFWRTAMSGGRATIQIRKGFKNKSQVGDIGAVDALGEELLLQHVIVECKFHKNVDIVLGFLQQRGRLFGWWEKEVLKSAGTGREPFMIVLENRVPAMLITTPEACDKLNIKHDSTDYACWLSSWSRTPYVFLFDDIVPRLKAWAQPKG